MNILLDETADKHELNAVKARTDIKTIAAQRGYREITLFHSGNAKYRIPFEIVVGCVKAIRLAGKGDKVLIEYPYYPLVVDRLITTLLRFGRLIKGYRITLLLHDVVALRSKMANPKEGMRALRSETRIWRGLDCVICHNESMLEMLRAVDTKTNYVALGPFYYLYDGPVCARTYSKNPTVMIAGNLAKEKCAYVYKLTQVMDVRFDLFGSNYSGQSGGNVCYRGAYPASELIPHLDGQFGLVWDGDSLDTCDGDFGEYLKYNNPHKFSLYLAAGVPIIVWGRSALADFVKKNKVGICIESLHDLPEILNGISENDYQRIVQNVESIRKDIILGNRLKRWI